MCDPIRVEDKAAIPEPVLREVRKAISSLHMGLERRSDAEGNLLVDNFVAAEHALQHLRAITR
jgi:hypothetical protein